MIYLFDRAKKLQKIIPRKHIINANPTVVRNGIYQLAVEVPLFYEDKKGTQYNYQKSVGKATFAGHYDDKNRFQLYKIYSRNITANEQGEFLLFDGVHIFFDEAKAMGNIHDRRFRDSEAKAPADAAFNSIGWTIIDYDVTDRHDINFYRASVTDAWNDLISTYGVEFDYELQFDGRKIISKNIIMKKQIGKWTGQRFAYGTNVLTLTQEQDESEVYTAAVGRGRGEESGDGFGPRLEFGDIAWSKDGITKPVGQNYIELPSATAEYGFIENGVVKPRIAPEVVFEDIEDKKKLADSTYYWLLENCVPKATWKTDVARIGNLSLGDTVGVLYKAAGIIKRARVEKIEYNLLDPKLSKLTLGDFHHFENRQMKRINAQIKRLGRDTSDRITRIKNEWNAWIDNQFTAALNEFEQNLIDQQAQIEADRENMSNLIEGTRTEFTDNLNAEIAQTKEYAEQQAQAKADAVRTDLETVTSGHQEMLDNLESNVINIDEFLGDSRSVTLDERLLNINQNFDERIRNIDSSVYNMLRDTRFDENFWRTFSGSTIQTDESINYARFNLTVNNQPNIRTSESLRFDEGTQYRIVIEYRTDAVPELDYMYLFPSSGGDIDINAIADGVGFRELNTDGKWNKRVLTFTPNRTLDAVLAIGSRRSTGDGTMGIIDVRLPYLTTTSNVNWVYHPLDATQNISEVSRRITNLEDGYSELTTRNEFDFTTGKLDQHIKSVESTVEGNYQVLQRVEDWQATNGASIEETVYGFNQKVWLNDVASIGANLVPQSERAWENGGIGILSGAETNNSSSLRTKQYIPVEPSTEYTFKDNSSFNSSVRYIDVHQYDSNGTWIRNWRIERGGSQTFTTWNITATVRIGLVASDGFSILSRFIENPDKRIHLKLEKGNTATPMINALSRIEQLADKINMSVIELDGTYLKQSDFQLTPNYWQLGSMRIGADNVSSVLRGSPDALDAVVSNFNLTGNLNARGQITTLAVDAIEGNFARLFANQLTANVITSDHIQVGTALVDKMFATSARIDQLITKTHFVNEMHALTLNVVELNASQVRARLLTANTIEAEWIKSGTALLDRVFSSTAMFERMMAKSGFVTTLNTVTIDTDQLTIRRPDGVAWVTNGVHQFNLSIQRNQFMDPSVSWTGQNYTIPDQFWRTIENMYIYHDSRYLATAFLVSLTGTSSSDSAYVQVRVREFSSGNLVGEAKVLAKKAETTSQSITLDMGKPTFTAKQFYLEVKMDEETASGDGWRNYGLARVNRAVMRG